jgi:sensor histidine kinase YesM
MFSTPARLRPIWPHIAIWGFLLIVPAFIRIPPHKEVDFTNLPGSIFFGMNLLNIGLFYLNAYFFYPRLMNKRQWWLYVILATGSLGLLFLFKITVIRNWFAAIPLDSNTWRFAFFSTFVFLIASIIYRAILGNIRRNKELREIQSEKLMTELKFLRSQISPHFLFNVLTNLVSLARTGSKKLEPSLIMLADLMRYMLYESAEKKVTMDSELRYLKSYIQLQQLRFGDDVQIVTDYEIADRQDLLAIEPMLLIPFVENAFKHGVGWIEKPAIGIRLSLSGGILDLLVHNKFNDQEDSKDPNSGIGLTNVQTRLQLMYPGKHTLSLQKIAAPPAPTTSPGDNTYSVHLTIDLT